MARPKITLVGGGSYGWSPTIIRDTLHKPELQDAEFRLLDINPTAAGEIRRVGERYAREMKVGATFLPLKDADRALSGADFVVITISTGGLDAMAHDLKIPERYGIFHTVGDSVGPGGWARGLRNIPVFMDLAARIRKCAPDAMILNYTNPMSTLTKALTLLTPQPVVGLCHGLFGSIDMLMKIFKLKSRDEIAARYCGVNHFFWITDFTVRGEPGYPMLAARLRGGKRLDDLIQQVYRDAFGHASYRILVATELYEEFGYLTYFGDRHTSEFFGRYLTRTRETLRKYKLHQTTIAERKKNFRDAWKRVQDWGAGRTPLPMDPARETAADIMAARWANHQFVDVMNLPNQGQIRNLPFGAVVETPGVVNSTGFSPVCMGEMPAPLAAMILPHVCCQDLIVQAGMAGDWNKAFQALIGDPLCSWMPVPTIKKMGRELLEANRRYLPQFFGKKACPERGQRAR